MVWLSGGDGTDVSAIWPGGAKRRGDGVQGEPPGDHSEDFQCPPGDGLPEGT